MARWERYKQEGAAPLNVPAGATSPLAPRPPTIPPSLRSRRSLAPATSPPPRRPPTRDCVAAPAPARRLPSGIRVVQTVDTRGCPTLEPPGLCANGLYLSADNMICRTCADKLSILCDSARHETKHISEGRAWHGAKDELASASPTTRHYRTSRTDGPAFSHGPVLKRVE